MHTHSARSADVFYPLFVANGVTGIRDAGSPVPLDTLLAWPLAALATHKDDHRTMTRRLSMMQGDDVGANPPATRGEGRTRRRVIMGMITLALGLLRVSSAAPQTPAVDPVKVPVADTAAITASAAAISADEIARHLAVLTRDSVSGRETADRGLERTARYVADQFKTIGLVPAGDSGGWLQRYPVPRHAGVDYGQSDLIFKVTRAKPVVDETGRLLDMDFGMIHFSDSVVVIADTVLDLRAPAAFGGAREWLSFDHFTGPTPVVVAGPHTLASVRAAKLHDQVVVYLPPASGDSTVTWQVLAFLRASNHVILLEEDSARFAARRRAAQAHPPTVLEWFLPEARRLHRWALSVWAPALQRFLARAGFDMAEARTSATPIVRTLAGVAFPWIVGAPAATGPTATNVIGLLPGRDSGRVIMLTVHVDHAAGQAAAAARASGGNDYPSGDNAADVAGILALAKAFTRMAQAGVQPRRPIAFAVVSGGAPEFWGSSALVDTWPNLHRWQQIVLNLNLDRLGHLAPDSLWINGAQEVELAPRAAWVAAQHPELGLTVVDGGSVVTPESDHFPFVRKALPSLYVHGSPDSAADTPAPPNLAQTMAQEARALRFVFWLLLSVADAPAEPRWTPAGRRQRGTMFGE